jgi:hypothetical protein
MVHAGGVRGAAESARGTAPGCRRTRSGRRQEVAYECFRRVRGWKRRRRACGQSSRIAVVSLSSTVTVRRRLIRRGTVSWRRAASGRSATTRSRSISTDVMCGGRSGWDGVSGPMGFRMVGSSMMRHDRPKPDSRRRLEMADETAETVCEAFDRLTAGNPRFIAAPRTKQAMAIIGARPTAAAAAADAGQPAPAATHPRRTGEA